MLTPIQSVLVKDTGSTTGEYVFCSASDSFVNVIDSEFRNLSNFEFALITSPMVVRGSKFIDLNQTYVPLAYLALYEGPYDGFAFKNNSFE